MSSTATWSPRVLERARRARHEVVADHGHALGDRHMTPCPRASPLPASQRVSRLGTAAEHSGRPARRGVQEQQARSGRWRRAIARCRGKPLEVHQQVGRLGASANSSSTESKDTRWSAAVRASWPMIVLVRRLQLRVECTNPRGRRPGQARQLVACAVMPPVLGPGSPASRPRPPAGSPARRVAAQARQARALGRGADAHEPGCRPPSAPLRRSPRARGAAAAHGAAGQPVVRRRAKAANVEERRSDEVARVRHERGVSGSRLPERQERSRELADGLVVGRPAQLRLVPRPSWPQVHVDHVDRRPGPRGAAARPDTTAASAGSPVSAVEEVALEAQPLGRAASIVVGLGARHRCGLGGVACGLYRRGVDLLELPRVSTCG